MVVVYLAEGDELRVLSLAVRQKRLHRVFCVVEEVLLDDRAKAFSQDVDLRLVYFDYPVQNFLVFAPHPRVKGENSFNAFILMCN